MRVHPLMTVYLLFHGLLAWYLLPPFSLHIYLFICLNGAVLKSLFKTFLLKVPSSLEIRVNLSSSSLFSEDGLLFFFTVRECLVSLLYFVISSLVLLTFLLFFSNTDYSRSTPLQFDLFLQQRNLAVTAQIARCSPLVRGPCSPDFSAPPSNTFSTPLPPPFIFCSLNRYFFLKGELSVAPYRRNHLSTHSCSENLLCFRHFFSLFPLSCLSRNALMLDFPPPKVNSF